MKILVFGGTQFMGRLTVEALLNAGHEVTVFNRGHTINPFEGHPSLRTVKCDRMTDRERWRQLVQEQGVSDVSIDFVGFHEVYIQDTLDALTLDVAGKKEFATKHYIFISTDSVYWSLKLPESSGRLAENDAQEFSPPEFDKHIEDHCNKTPLGEYQLRYGGNKLACERLLDQALQTGGLHYTVLRLPDVYGPYDNLGGFWDLVLAIEGRRPIPSRLQPGRIRPHTGASTDPKIRRFSWAFAEDVRDAIVECIHKGTEVHGVTLHIGHEEAVNLHETATMVAEAMGLGVEALRYDDRRDATVPSADYGVLDVSRALRLLRPWRPTPMRAAVTRSVKWFLSSKEHRRYHRLVHREPRHYDETGTRAFSCTTFQTPTCWAGALERAKLLHDGPVMLQDALPDLTGQAVLGFMQRLMDQAGETNVTSELHKGPEVEHQTWALRYFAGHLLPNSRHDAAYRLEDPQLLQQTDLLPEFQSPVGDIRADNFGEPPKRTLRLGGVGGRDVLQRKPMTDTGGIWDCVLLGRRRWRMFPPTTPAIALHVPNGSNESPVDTFVCGPDRTMISVRFPNFKPIQCWECEQIMGDAVVVPNGWWYQAYDDDRTLSISAEYGAVLGVTSDEVVSEKPDSEPEVIDFEIVD